MTNLEIAKLFRKMAAAYTILGAMPAGRQENRFKIIAYENAATAVEHATSELKDLWDDGQLQSVSGLGPGMISHLDEIFKTGKSKHIDEVLSHISPTVFPLLDVPGIGAKRASSLVKGLKLRGGIEELEKACQKHLVAKIEGFGEKSEQEILKNIERFKKGAVKEKRMVLPVADALADGLIQFLRGVRGIGEIEIDKLGSLRRRVATIGDIDLAVATKTPEKVIEAFVAYPGRKTIIEKGSAGASIVLVSGVSVDLRVARPESYGAMLQYFTGSKQHNIHLRELALKKGLSLSEYGIKDLKSLKVLKFAKEDDFYHYLGLEWIAPELREGRGEIGAAGKAALPNLVLVGDIKGDFHVHSSFDQKTSHDSGQSTIEEIRDEAERLGYDFVAISDHNPSQSGHTPSQIVDQLRRKKEIYEHINSSTEKRAKSNNHTRVYNFLEVDILPDGDLGIPSEAVDLLDGCLVAVHSSFNLSRTEMTERIIRGLSHPKAKILAHPTGRILGYREGYEVNWEKIFDFCLKNNKALEINCFPNRLDLPDALVFEAVSRGVMLTIGTDAHDLEAMSLMSYGVSVARRGWASKESIINAQSCDKIDDWLGK